MPRLAHSLNRPIVVVLPGFFGDQTPRRLTLIDLEEAGLWLSGEPLGEVLGKFEETTAPDEAAAAFFPFEQVAWLFDPAQFTYLGTGAGLTAAGSRFGSALKTATPASVAESVSKTETRQKKKPRKSRPAR
jgi:hypothetical protein